MPFFFVAITALLNDTLASIRTASLIYAAHVCTTVIPLVAELALKEYPAGEVGPSTTSERALLISLYSPYFAFPLLLGYTVYPMHPTVKEGAGVDGAKPKRR